MERAEERLQDEESPLEIFDWLSGEVSTYARANSSRELTKATIGLYFSQQFYEDIVNNRIREEIKGHFYESNILQSVDEKALI